MRRISDLAEDLPGVGVVARFLPLEEAGEHHGARVSMSLHAHMPPPRESKAARHAAEIAAEVIAIDLRRRVARIHIDVGERRARGEAYAPRAEHLGIHAGDEAAEIAVGGRGIAVAVEIAPGAIGSCPKGERRGRRRAQGLVVTR